MTESVGNSILLGSELDRLKALAIQNRDQTEDNVYGWVHVDAVNTLRLIEEVERLRDQWVRAVNGAALLTKERDDLRRELEAMTTYADCLARGLSDAEARGTAWPND